MQRSLQLQNKLHFGFTATILNVQCRLHAPDIADGTR